MKIENSYFVLPLLIALGCSDSPGDGATTEEVSASGSATNTGTEDGETPPTGGVSDGTGSVGSGDGGTSTGGGGGDDTGSGGGDGTEDDTPPGPGTSPCDADATVVDSLADLLPYLDDDDVSVQLAPGTYRIDNDVVDALFPDAPLFEVTGNNSTYCFTGATIEFDTEIFQSFGSVGVTELYVGGSGNILKNLTMTDIGDTRPSKTALAIQEDGTDNLIEGFHLTIRGSEPYAYGDMFGKGSGYVIKHFKHAAILLTGTDVHLKDITIIHRAYGHGIFMQGAVGVLIEGIYLEGELRTTDEVLAEEDTGTSADNVDFMTVWGYRVPAGYRFSLQEDGIRAYRNSANGRIASDITVRDSVVKFMRSGVGIGLGNGPQHVENVTSLGNESGFWTAGGDVVDCRGDASVGPLYSEDNAKNGSDIELTLLDHAVPRIGDTPLLYLAGSNHEVTLHDGTTMPLDDSLEIFIGGPRNGHRSDGEVMDANGITLVNETSYPVNDYQ